MFLAAALVRILVALALVTGVHASAASASGWAPRVEASALSFDDHSPLDDEEPTGSDKAIPHHHCPCHTHQIGLPVTAEAIAFDSRGSVLAGIDDRRGQPSFSPGQDLRPPIA